MMSLDYLLSTKYLSISYSKLLLNAFISDSSPVIGVLRSIGTSFSIIIRNPVVRYIASVLVQPLRLSVHTILGVERMTTRYLKALLNLRLLPWINSQTPWLYIFSKKDEVVP